MSRREKFCLPPTGRIEWADVARRKYSYLTDRIKGNPKGTLPGRATDEYQIILLILTPGSHDGLDLYGHAYAHESMYEFSDGLVLFYIVLRQLLRSVVEKRSIICKGYLLHSSLNINFWKNSFVLI